MSHGQPQLPTSPEAPKKSAWSRIYYGGGIVVTISVYSFLQERVVSEPYGGEFFQATMFLVLCNRLVSIAYALLMIRVNGENCRKQASLWKYVVVSLSNILSTWCQYESLRYVSLVLQTMGKTFKMLPVMLMGVILSRKKHGLDEFLAVIMVTLGITAFVVGGKVNAAHAEQSTSIYGMMLLLAFLSFDGFTSTFQEKLFKEDKMSKYNQMLYMNLSSAVVSLASLLGSNSLPYCWGFLSTHKDFASHVVALSVSAAAGQYYIFSMVKEFGALALAATMNVRQVTTICTVYIARPQTASRVQVIGLLTVFAGLAVKSCFRVQGLKHLQGSKSPTPNNDVENGDWVTAQAGDDNSKSPGAQETQQSATELQDSPKGSDASDDQDKSMAEISKLLGSPSECSPRLRAAPQPIQEDCPAMGTELERVIGFSRS